MQERLDQIEKRMSVFEEQLTIRVMNGRVKDIPLKEAVGDIWNATEPLRDFIKVYAILKKWKKLWITLAILIVALWGKGEIIDILKLLA